MVDQARSFAEKGAAIGTPETDWTTYARVLGRAHQYETVYQRMTASDEPNMGGLRALGETVRDYYTPEEKTAFAAFLEKQRKPGSRTGLETAEAAGLEDVTARWLVALLCATPGDALAQNELIDHQTRRIRFAELGAQLEALWRSVPPDNDAVRRCCRASWMPTRRRATPWANSVRFGPRVRSRNWPSGSAACCCSNRRCSRMSRAPIRPATSAIWPRTARSRETGPRPP